MVVTEFYSLAGDHEKAITAMNEAIAISEKLEFPEIRIKDMDYVQVEKETAEDPRWQAIERRFELARERVKASY